ncbi:VPA1262 family protein [Agrobacterium sp. SOY23]|uniref:VPA1262 family protein n=1 Tax=Agrobacterium sp. SOY23 TaxID=3014555 RepID=UPI0022AEDA1D|nr:VPA1262 family protein [Agrobacterium sp. SOY23]MCZ4432032.1 VPA1262 family protein [Agrobacterium sp. SOY23]
MGKHAKLEQAAPTLDDLLNDDRLGRLFSSGERDCALQLWVMRIESADTIENRIIYGRLVPYNFSSDSWSASDNNDSHVIGEADVKIEKLSLYIRSVRCAELLRHFSTGRTISEISDDLKLTFQRKKLKAQFGTASLTAGTLVYRPVSYLINRDAYERSAPSSPHGGSGAYSASIVQANKEELFRLLGEYSVRLTELLVRRLDADTGLDFGGVDSSRLGDIELMVFPTLDDRERQLLDVKWTESPLALTAQFDPQQVSLFTGFQFRLVIENGGQIAYSAIAFAERTNSEIFECKFELPDQFRSRTDSTELEIYGFNDNHLRQGILCCRWRISYIREISFSGHALGHSSSPVKFDWLEKTTRPAASARVKGALTIDRSSHAFKSSVGGRAADPWVPANHNLGSLFARLHPSKSDGRFFLRWSEGNGDGRLQFVEWFKQLLNKYRDHQIVIFDPYFEDVGLSLMVLGASAQGDYIVFTSLPKVRHKADGPVADGSESATPTRISNLIAICENNRNRIEHLKLRIYGLKEGRLHDRYVLFMAPDGLPAAGFHFSNSLQKAAENYPLLITPIPADTLLAVEDYKSTLIQEAKAAQSTEEADNPSMRLLFETKTSRPMRMNYEPLQFLEKMRAGDVLSAWTGEISLEGLNGAELKKQMTDLGLLKDEALALPDTPGLRNCVTKQAENFDEFEAWWGVIGDILAHSHIDDRVYREFQSDHGLLQLLAQVIERSFSRAHDAGDKEWTVLDSRLFQSSLDELLHSPYRLDHLSHMTKFSGLAWSEFFAIKILWLHTPEVLLQIAEAKIGSLPEEPKVEGALRLSLLSQIACEISLSADFNINPTQRDSLIRSQNSLMHWMGLNAIERQLGKSEGPSEALRLIAAFPYPEQIHTLGWMICRAAKNPEKSGIYDALLAALRDALPSPIPAEDLKRLVRSMRGHMPELAWAEPWLSRDVIFPLLESERANIDDACGIWFEELNMLLGPMQKDSRLFEKSREGQTTNIAAILFAYSSNDQQASSLNVLKSILKGQKHAIQQPLASTSNWSRWNDALLVAMWIFAFTRWAQYYVQRSGKESAALEELSREAEMLATARPLREWRAQGARNNSGIAAFLDQAEELLTSTAKAEGENDLGAN